MNLSWNNLMMKSALQWRINQNSLFSKLVEETKLIKAPMKKMEYWIVLANKMKLRNIYLANLLGEICWFFVPQFLNIIPIETRFMGHTLYNVYVKFSKNIPMNLIWKICSKRLALKCKEVSNKTYKCRNTGIVDSTRNCSSITVLKITAIYSILLRHPQSLYFLFSQST